MKLKLDTNSPDKAQLFLYDKGVPIDVEFIHYGPDFEQRVIEAANNLEDRQRDREVDWKAARAITDDLNAKLNAS